MKNFDSSILCAPSKFHRQLVYLNLELKNTFSTENCPTFLWKDEGKELSFKSFDFLEACLACRVAMPCSLE